MSQLAFGVKTNGFFIFRGKLIEIYRAQGRNEEARSLYLKALELSKKE